MSWGQISSQWLAKRRKWWLRGFHWSIRGRLVLLASTAIQNPESGLSQCRVLSRWVITKCYLKILNGMTPEYFRSCFVFRDYVCQKLLKKRLLCVKSNLFQGFCSQFWKISMRSLVVCGSTTELHCMRNFSSIYQCGVVEELCVCNIP